MYWRLQINGKQYEGQTIKSIINCETIWRYPVVLLNRLHKSQLRSTLIAYWADYGTDDKIIKHSRCHKAIINRTTKCYWWKLYIKGKEEENSQIDKEVWADDW